MVISAGLAVVMLDTCAWYPGLAATATLVGALKSLTTLDKTAKLSLASIRNDKPVVLVFGSYT